ncbi:hypothetical protein [Mameliella alba]|uniref:hypothetical protein n=1 Tax=Mameliella alba TaxID=561184 RepID=UPI000B53810B|nr:hypothetical protein [Mameliella alba]OWV40411.1 hypothetical protein CDZ95_21525 [Mameliella alba]
MTRIPRDFTADLIVPPSGAFHPIAAIDAWLRLKERQRLEDGTSAAIEPAQLNRLSTLPGHHRPVTGPTPANEIEAARLRALPATRAAVRRKLALLKGGAV